MIESRSFEKRWLIKVEVYLNASCQDDANQKADSIRCVIETLHERSKALVAKPIPARFGKESNEPR